MRIETPTRPEDVTTPPQTPRRARSMDVETRIRLFTEMFERMGIVTDPEVPTEELVRRAQETTRHLGEEDPTWASRELIAMRDE